MIAKNYLIGPFIIELIPVVPLQLLPMGGDENRLYIIKLIRIIYGISHVDPSKIYEALTLFNQERIKKILEDDYIKANSRDTDQIYLKYLMIFKYFVSTCKLMLTIMSVSYFLGVIWYIFSFEMYHHVEDELELLNENVYNT